MFGFPGALGSSWTAGSCPEPIEGAAESASQPQAERGGGTR